MVAPHSPLGYRLPRFSIAPWRSVDLSITESVVKELIPNRLPNKTPAPDLNTLKKDSTGEYALSLFEIAVFSSLRYDDAGKLLSWAASPRPQQLSCKEALDSMFQKVGEAALSEGFDKLRDQVRPLNNLLNQCADIMRRSHAVTGRPSHKRQAAVKALIHHQYLGTHWPKLADKFCTCGQSNHDTGCANSLKAEVQHLKLEMKKNQVELHQGE